VPIQSLAFTSVWLEHSFCVQRFLVMFSIVRPAVHTGHMLQPRTCFWWCVLLLLAFSKSSVAGFPQLLLQPGTAFVKPSIAKLVKPAGAGAAGASDATATSTTTIQASSSSSSSSGAATTQAASQASPRVQHIILNHKPYASTPAASVNFTIYPTAAAAAASQAAPQM
jgi:hypothetical protein